ncbi:MAG TPA: hypothetical protein VFU02_16005, partial [Polyangiaceae bacterium]|nr:hypothetical protein [Polyangiaceae bacterium]
GERRGERHRKGGSQNQSRARDSGIHPTFEQARSADGAKLAVVPQNPEASAVARTLLVAIRDTLHVEMTALEPRFEPALLAHFDVQAELLDLEERTCREQFDVAQADAAERERQQGEAGEAERDASEGREQGDAETARAASGEVRAREATDAGRELDRAVAGRGEREIARNADAAAREGQVIFPTRVRGPQWFERGSEPSAWRQQGAIVFELDPGVERGTRVVPGDTPPQAPSSRPSSNDARLDDAIPEVEADAGTPDAKAQAEAKAAQEQARAATKDKQKQDEEQHEKQKKADAAARKGMASAKVPGSEAAATPTGREPGAPELETPHPDGVEAAPGAEAERAPEVVPAPQEKPLLAVPVEQPTPLGAHLPPASGVGGGGGNELGAWKAAADAATAALPMPNIGPASARTGGMSEEADRVSSAGEEQRKNLPEQAEAILDAKPRDASQLSEIAQEVLQSDPTGTLQVVKDSAHRAGLPPQALPNLRATPKGNVPNLFGDPITPARFNQLRKEYGLPEGAHAPDARELDLFAKKMAEDPDLGGRVAGFAGQLITGGDLPPKPEVAPARQGDFAAVLARIMTGSAEVAKGTIDAARDLAYANQGLTHAFGDLGNEWIADEERFLHGEMQRVADAAGISSEKLNEAVAQRQKELADKTGGTRAEGEKVYADARETISADFEKTHAHIEGLRQEWEEFADERAASMKGNVDAKAVRARQRELESTVSTFAAEWIVAYDDMGKERVKKLGEAAQQQQQAYRKAIELDQAEDVATAEEAGDTEKAEAIKTDKDKVYTNWIVESMKPVQEVIKLHVQNNTSTVAAWQAEMRKKRDGALEELRTWGDKQIGRERGFFDMILDWIFGWEKGEKEEAKAFAKQRASETTVAMASSFQRLDAARANFGETLEADERAQLKGLGEEERAVLEAYYAEGGGDTIGAVAAGLKVRLKKQRTGEIAKAMQRQVLAMPTNDTESADGLPVLALKGFSVPVRPIST